jgi:transcriptional regulator with XRE-family HTH domain
MLDMHEGKRVKELIDAKGITMAALAKSVGKTQPAAQKWCSTEEFNGNMWKTVSAALTKVGIDPSQVRAVAATMYRERPAANLRPLLVRFAARDQLEALRQILEAPPDDQRVLLAIIEDRLDQR